VFKIKPEVFNQNINQNTESNFLFTNEEICNSNQPTIKKSTKTCQLVFLFLVCNLFTKIKESSSINQRIIAKQLKIHHNSINYILKLLEQDGKIRCKYLNNKKVKVKVNLYANSSVDLILLLSQELVHYFINKNIFGFTLDEDNECEKQEYDAYTKRLLEKQIQYILSQKKQLSQRLAKDIVTNITEAQNSALVVLDTSDYNAIIIELLENIGLYLPEFLISKLPVKLKAKREQLRTKLNKM